MDKNTESILFLSNHGAAPARIGLSITAGGVHYYLTELSLAPGETRAINIRQLRDAGIADFKGHMIPANATDGSIDWIRLDNVPVSGRVMVISRGQGIASSYDCYNCPCPANYSLSGIVITPETFDILVGAGDALDATGTYSNCNGETYYSDLTLGSSWSSYDTSIAAVDTYADVTGVGAGSTPISAYTNGTVYEVNPSDSECVAYNYNEGGNSTANVCGLTISSPADGQVFDLGGANYDTAAIPLEADSSCSGTASWTLGFSYTAGDGNTYTDQRGSSSTVNSELNYQTIAGDGGEIALSASASLGGSSLSLSQTQYVDGTAIPNATITSRLEGLYSNGATPALLTGIAYYESGQCYCQFSLRSLYLVYGKWPVESQDGGSHVGLMQVPNTLGDAFDWMTNTYDGWTIFESKLASAQRYVSNQIGAHPSLPPATPTQYEDDALVYYGPYGAAGPYWVPSSDYTSWVPNPSNSNGVTYADTVRGFIQ